MTDSKPEPNVHPQPPTTTTPEHPDPFARLHRPPDEGPAPTGGSAITDEDPAAEEEVGGG